MRILFHRSFGTLVLQPGDFANTEMKYLIIALALFLPSIGLTQEVFAPGIISTSKNEYGLTFITEDLVCFTRTDDRNILFLSERKQGKWQQPTIAPFSGKYDDEYPKFDPRSGRLYFSSKRPVNSETPFLKNDIWYVEYVKGKWSNPVHLENEFSKDGIDSGAHSNGSMIYFHSDRSGSGLRDVDIYCLDISDSSSKPTKLDISSNQVDGDVYLSSDGKWMVFMSAREGSVGEGDIYYSVREDGKFTSMTSIDKSGIVNTAGWEWAPSLSLDGKILYFTRIVNGNTEILFVPIARLGIDIN